MGAGGDVLAEDDTPARSVYNMYLSVRPEQGNCHTDHRDEKNCRDHGSGVRSRFGRHSRSLVRLWCRTGRDYPARHSGRRSHYGQSTANAFHPASTKTTLAIDSPTIRAPIPERCFRFRTSIRTYPWRLRDRNGYPHAASSTISLKARCQPRIPAIAGYRSGIHALLSGNRIQYSLRPPQLHVVRHVAAVAVKGI